jgi:hypothetical protein
MNAPIARAAHEYTERYGLALVPIPPVDGHPTKGPTGHGWNDPANLIVGPDAAADYWNAHPDHNMGAALGASGIVALDIDNIEATRAVCAELGVDYDALLDGAPRIEGKPGHDKALFAAPEGVPLATHKLSWPARDNLKQRLTVFELRAGAVQDVLPPSMHPDTGKPYSWRVEPNGQFPPLPGVLLELWRSWTSYQSALVEICPWAPRRTRPLPRRSPRQGGVIAAFNAAHDIEAMLDVYGYSRRGKRWLPPHPECAIPGVVLLNGKVYSHHSDDPLCDGHAHDAFDLFRILDHGGDARKAARAAAELLGLERTPPHGEEAITPAPSAQQETPPIEAYAGDAEADTRPEIPWLPGELPDIVDKAEAALLASGERIFQYAGETLVRPIRTNAMQTDGIRRAEGALLLSPICVPYLIERMTAAAQWLKHDARSKKWVPTCCPDKVAAIYLARRGRWNAPFLLAVVRYPVPLPDGRVLTNPGYDAETGILVDIAEAWPMPEVFTLEAAKAACERLRHLLRHFPWVSNADRAVALSMLLTAIARPVLPAAPMHAVDAPEAGTGKSLLVDAAALLATGATASVMNYGRDPDEAAKRLDGMLLAGDPLIALDNIEAPLEGAALNQTLTQMTRRVRPLGTSTIVTVPCRAFICATGNNLMLQGDIVRRALVCRLDAKTERPEERAIDQNLLAEASERRRELVTDALTIMVAYAKEGRPDVELKPLGSFEAWSRMVRSALVWAGEADPVSVMERIRGADLKRQALHAVLSAWHKVFGDRPQTVAQAVSVGGEALRAALWNVAGDKDGINAKRLGRWMSNNIGRVMDELRLERAGTKQSISKWIVIHADGGFCGFCGFRTATREKLSESNGGRDEGQECCVVTNTEGRLEETHQTHETHGALSAVRCLDCAHYRDDTYCAKGLQTSDGTAPRLCGQFTPRGEREPGEEG